MNWPLTQEFADAFAAEWIEAWNAQNLERILRHYAQDVVFTSPFVSRFLGRNDNTVRGAAVLRIYFGRALNSYPDLRFLSQRVYLGAQSVVIEYQSVLNLMATEVMEFNDVGRVCRALAHYATANETSANLSRRSSHSLPLSRDAGTFVPGLEQPRSSFLTQV